MQLVIFTEEMGGSRVAYQPSEIKLRETTRGETCVYPDIFGSGSSIGLRIRETFDEAVKLVNEALNGN